MPEGLWTERRNSVTLASVQAVSDTSPLIAFSAIGRLDVLRQVFDSILIPQAVVDDVVAKGVGWVAAIPLQQAVQAGGWIKTRKFTTSPFVTPLPPPAAACSL